MCHHSLPSLICGSPYKKDWGSKDVDDWEVVVGGGMNYW
jgi:hypothetical protein